MKYSRNFYLSRLLLMLLLTLPVYLCEAQQGNKNTPTPSAFDFHDSHFHLTNYIQEGADIHKYLTIMGSRVGRSTLFGIPLQQMWSYQNSGSFAPAYYLQSDAPLYYYSFTDAYIASVYNSLSAADKQRFDPMITGFNPADMYAKAHIRRVLLTFPGVFSGIGEFSIHKEFVLSKVAGEVASLTNPALDSILDFAGEVGLAVNTQRFEASPGCVTKGTTTGKGRYPSIMGAAPCGAGPAERCYHNGFYKFTAISIAYSCRG